MKPDPKAEGLRWLKQAERDLEFRALKPKAAPLDHYYVPTRYPNSLPGGIPAEAFDEVDARRALALAGEVIRLVKAKLAKETT